MSAPHRVIGSKMPLQQAHASSSSLNVQNNSYKAQRLWPPDFAKMDPKEQLRLERRYRRRAKLAYTRPRWNQAVKLTQWGSITCMCHPITVASWNGDSQMGIVVLGYSVLFMDWGSTYTPFDGVSISVMLCHTRGRLITHRYVNGFSSAQDQYGQQPRPSLRDPT